MNSETIKQLKPSCSIILGNFNARSKLWWPDDIRPPEGTGIDSLQTIHGLHQLISDPTHILTNPLSCIDLIFNFMDPYYGWGSTVSRLQNHFKETVYFLLIKLTWQLTVVFILPCIQFAFTKLFILKPI